jgi:hypothetical protein
MQIYSPKIIINQPAGSAETMMIWQQLLPTKSIIQHLVYMWAVFGTKGLCNVFTSMRENNYLFVASKFLSFFKYLLHNRSEKWTAEIVEEIEHQK